MNICHLLVYLIHIEVKGEGSVILVNNYMIAKWQGMLVISQKPETEFKRLLVVFYEDRDSGELMEFVRNKCWRTF